jgi:hypothetical protein
MKKSYNEQISKPVGAKASVQLKGPASTAAQKAVAGSALT